MSVVLGTLCLNEMEWLPRFYRQHKDWPGLLRWVFVEAADASYAAANPDLVTPEGFSTDGTSDFLSRLEKIDDRVTYVRHGNTSSPDPAQSKCAARQRYLDVANEVKPTIVVTLDADEFYTRDHQEILEPKMMSQPGPYGIIFHRVEIWRPPSIVDRPLMDLEVVGGFWAIPCCHWWKWHEGMCYRDNHNTPQVGDQTMGRYIRCDRHADSPQMIHMGFAATKATRLAKNRYYVQRGEGKTDNRAWYVASRAAFETWKPGDGLPSLAQVIPYKGPVPECFKEQNI